MQQKNYRKLMKNVKNIREDSTQTVYGVFISFDSVYRNITNKVGISAGQNYKTIVRNTGETI